MSSTSVEAWWISNGLNLEALAKHFGIVRRSRWEDLLQLGPVELRGILSDPTDKRVHLTPFGAVVAFGLGHHEVMDLVLYLRRLDPRLQDPQEPFTDRCTLEFDEGFVGTTGDRVGVARLEDWTHSILSLVLAKSVALERVEIEIERLLDEARPVVEELAHGRVAPSDRMVSRLAGRILSFRLDTVAYIHLLDKPDATWDNPSAEDFHGRLSQFFELADRYEKIQSKSQVLMDLTDVVAGYAHHHRDARLEWVIILLIVAEIALSLFQMVL